MHGTTTTSMIEEKFTSSRRVAHSSIMYIYDIVFYECYKDLVVNPRSLVYRDGTRKKKKKPIIWITT